MGESGERSDRRWRRRVAWAAAVVVVLGVAIAAVVIHNGRKDRLAAGATSSQKIILSGAGPSVVAPFTVPNAGLLVQASTGASGSVEDSDHEVHAPRGGVLVRLVWTSTGSGSPAAELAGSGSSTLVVRSQQTRVTVDREIAPTTGEQQAVVALAGNAADVVLEVRFAGRSQSIDLQTGRRHPGAFASLYRGWTPPSGPSAALSVEQDQPTDPKSAFTWNAEVPPQAASRVPYLSALGWAREGREWVTVTDVAYRLSPEAAEWRAGERRARYAVVGKPRLTVTVAGRAPVRVLRPSGEAGGGTYVFSVARGDAVTVRTVLSAQVRRSSGDAHAPETSTLRVTRTEVRPAIATIGPPV